MRNDDIVRSDHQIFQPSSTPVARVAVSQDGGGAWNFWRLETQPGAVQARRQLKRTSSIVTLVNAVDNKQTSKCITIYSSDVAKTLRNRNKF